MVVRSRFERYPEPCFYRIVSAEPEFDTGRPHMDEVRKNTIFFCFFSFISYTFSFTHGWSMQEYIFFLFFLSLTFSTSSLYSYLSFSSLFSHFLSSLLLTFFYSLSLPSSPLYCYLPFSFLLSLSFSPHPSTYTFLCTNNLWKKKTQYIKPILAYNVYCTIFFFFFFFRTICMVQY